MVYTLLSFGLLFFLNKNMLNGNLSHRVLCFIYIWDHEVWLENHLQKMLCCLRWKRSSFSLCLMKPELKICSYFKTPEVCLNGFLSWSDIDYLSRAACVLCRYTRSNKETYQSRAAVFALCCLLNKHLHIENKPQSVFILCILGTEFISAGRLMFHYLSLMCVCIYWYIAPELIIK